MPLDLGSVIHAHTYTHTNTNAADTTVQRSRSRCQPCVRLRQRPYAKAGNATMHMIQNASAAMSTVNAQARFTKPCSCQGMVSVTT